MDEQEMNYMMITSLLTSIIVIILAIEIANPLLSPPVLTEKVANRVAMAVDTMAGIDQGEIKIPIDMEGEYIVRVSYEREGKKDGYEIEDEGWYVIARASMRDEEFVGLSKIHAYPSESVEELQVDLPRPRTVCITKVTGDNPKVNDCRS